jgi:NAD(P)-dependent dehydrogenase (short-subunit alcohol dehydrogenase family)
MDNITLPYTFITGATSGIGLAIAEELLRSGCFVLLNYAHDGERAESVRERLAEYAGRFEFVRADMSEYGGVEQVETFLQERGVQLTYLVLNCGATDRTVFGEVTVENWEHVMRANVSVPFFLIQRLFNADMMAENASILCIGSLMGSQPHSVSISYGVSKAAMSVLSRNLVKFLAPNGIRINTIEPGFVDTPWQKAKPSAQRRRIESKTALGRFADPREVAEMSAAILKNEYMTGSVVEISGGYGLG